MVTRVKHEQTCFQVYIMSGLDYPPVFDRKATQFYVSENSPLGRLVVQLRATVPLSDDESEDEEEGGKIKYRLVTTEYLPKEDNDSEEPLFQVDGAGRVIVSGRLDRESQNVHRQVISMNFGQTWVNSNSEQLFLYCF